MAAVTDWDNTHRLSMNSALHSDTVSDGTWDALRKDETLWAKDGNCIVHLYARGTSRRGPSFCLRLDHAEELQSSYLAQCCLRFPAAASLQGSEDGDDDFSDSGYASSPVCPIQRFPYELYIPAPPSLAKADAYAYHVTTRNYFAYLAGKPVVGDSLEAALVDLIERMRDWQDDQGMAQCRFLAYCTHQGYDNMAESPERAVVCLILAEQAQIRSLWVEAVVHCAGMYKRLDLSRVQGISDETKSVITRAYSDMDRRISAATRSVGKFLEQELVPEMEGASRSARNHLSRFRRSLHYHYNVRMGHCWGQDASTWTKQRWASMLEDFAALYDYIKNTNNAAQTGEWNVGRAVQAFDRRMGYTSMPYLLPLLPATAAAKEQPRKGFSLFKRHKSRVPEKMYRSSGQPLAEAVNELDEKSEASPLISEYQRFEQGKLEERLGMAEGRKVRWLLIYCTLQTLRGLMQAPAEVRDTQTPSYPLCVPAGSVAAPWEFDVESIYEDLPVDEEMVPAPLRLSMQPAKPVVHESPTPKRRSIVAETYTEPQNGFADFQFDLDGPRSPVDSLMKTETPLRPKPSMVSVASSYYPEDSRQAAEIDEEDFRGRRRTRELDSIRPAMMAAAGRSLYHAMV
ncbi:hypothetical protein K470DRAFT_266864 [Piedraia hortae CBS 480.64]|uniref:DUF8004 domain-containing protein n=1 Tax=Piedraia hortae CBS 480.64 TaxID=1314780 RepID=A0A6A7BQA1_9PEZI|nr:hypothetical protein K470DRAFT_266864 [Piedraia hortae CBS 480.64]